MFNGSFEDREDARLGVKQWLRSHAPSEYTAGNLRRLANDMMRTDREPLDHVRIALRERCYGIVKGLVEFAGEELAQGPEGAPLSLGRAHEEIACAAALLPCRSENASRHLRTALELMKARCGDDAAPSSFKAIESASVAVALALSMLGDAPMRSSA